MTLYGERPAPLTFVCYRLDVAAGMERAFARVAAELARTRGVRVVVLRGRTVAPSIRAVLGDIEVRFGVRYARPSTTREGAAGARTIIVGAWAALLAPHVFMGRSRVIVWEHTLLRERLPYYPTLRRALPVLRRLYAQADDIVCVSGAVRDFIGAAMHPANTTVIPNIVDDLPAAVRRLPRPGAGGIRLLSTQRMVPVKNVELAVRCLEHLPDTTTLVCAGDGPQRHSIEALVRSAGVTRRVELLGHVDDVGPLLAATDVLAHTARSETFGLSLVEAATHEVPVVCLDGGALTEMVPDYVPGVVAAAPDPAAFANAVREAASWSGNGARFAQAAARRRASFASDVVVARWNQVLIGAVDLAAVGE